MVLEILLCCMAAEQPSGELGNHTEQKSKSRHERVLNELPELEEGDKVSVTMSPDAPWSNDQRTLTVEKPSKQKTSDGVNGVTSAGYILSGYGTQYRLSVVESLTGAYERVNLSWKSRPSGRWVKSIEVLD